MKDFKKADIICGWVAFAIASISYLLTIEPTASYWDCGEFIVTAFRQEVGHPPGAPFFMIIGRIASLFAGGDATKVAAMINSMSALASGFTVLFLFWSITHIARKIFNPLPTDTARQIAILGCGLVGSLAYCYTDTAWFSAVEGEVYAMSSLFTAVVFWCILKWEEVADEKYANRWIILIAYLMGLSIGVHLLNLLAVPAIVFVYYFRKYTPSKKGIIVAFALSVAILGGILYCIIPGVVKIASMFELLFTNGFGAPYNTGTIIYAILGLGGLIWGIKYTYEHKKVWINTLLLAVTVIIIGYSSFAMIVIRSAAEPPMDENDPSNVFALQSYLNREQYGDRPLFVGEYFNSEVESYENGAPTYIQKNGRYEIAEYKTIRKFKSDQTTFFPRMYSSDASHIRGYQFWAGLDDTKQKPTFAQNLRFLFNYQIGYMYLRYFLWNFVGRQNDIQGHDANVMNGNWISGVGFIDNMRLGNQEMLPDYMKANKGANKYYFLPLILGILGMIFMYRENIIGRQYFWVVFLFFFLTGIAIVLYLNQTPYQPRERDYAYAGSFYVFAIYIGMGVAMLWKLVESFFKKEKERNLVAMAVCLVCILAAPVLMAFQNWDDHDRSNRYTARDFARNYLESCAPNAILFTNGDNDTFPLWYAQEVEGIRTDVRVVNLAYINTDWYINQMRRKAYQSEPLPISIAKEKLEPGSRDIVYINNQPNMFLTEKYLADKKSYQAEFESIYLRLIHLIKESDFATKAPSDYAKIVDQQTLKDNVDGVGRIVFALENKADAFGINKTAISLLKTDMTALMQKISNAPCPLKNVIDFVSNDDQSTKVRVGQNDVADFSPTDKFMLPVDKAKVIENGTVSIEDTAKIVDALVWKHPRGYIRKGELVVLDILANNNWERPVYFAITVGSESYQNLDAYFRLEGLAYRVVPIKSNPTNGERGVVNSDTLYNRLMEKFTWGGIDNPDVYLDENNLRMLMNVKSDFSRLANTLINERKIDRARQVLDKCYQVMPFETVAPNYYDVYLADSYYKIGDNTKAVDVLERLALQTSQEIRYFMSLDAYERSTIADDSYRSTAVAHEIVRTMRDNKDSTNAKNMANMFVKEMSADPIIASIVGADSNTQQFMSWYSSLPDRDKQNVSIYFYLLGE